MEVKYEKANRIRKNQYVLIDGEVCRVTDVNISSPGKHGAAKVRIVGIGLFDGRKREKLAPSDENIEVPVVERKTGQVLSVMGETVQVMDMESYETVEMEKGEWEVEAGDEVEYLEWGEKRKIVRVKKE